jgi:hypothetical protein
LILQFVALLLLISGPLSRYFPLFLYLFSLIGTTVVEAWVLRTVGTHGTLYFNVYWGGEILLDCLLFVLVISLTVRALEGNPLQPKIVGLLRIILVVALLVPFLMFDSAVFGRRWNQGVAQLFNFGAALMNLALWSALIVSRQRDRQLMMVSAGLGVSVVGSALTFGLRQFTAQDETLRTVVDLAHRVSQCAAPLIWCWAFRRVRPKTVVPASLDVTASAS